MRERNRRSHQVRTQDLLLTELVLLQSRLLRESAKATASWQERYLKYVLIAVALFVAGIGVGRLMR